MVRTLAVDKLALGIETFTPKAVQPLVFTEVNIPGIINFLQNHFNNSHVLFVCCADKMIVGDIKLWP